MIETILLTLTFPQLLIVIGLLMVIVSLMVGVEAVIDLILIGSILILSGLGGWMIGGTLFSLFLAIILSFIYFLYGRSILQDKLKTTGHSTNTDRLIGQRGIVTRPISPKKAGSIKIDDEEWRAVSKKKIEVDELVSVIKIKGVTLEVDK